jgi:lipopolysaccharide transport protein LptA
MLPNIDSPKMFRCLMVLLCTLGLTFISLSFKEAVDAAEKEKPTPETNKVSKENTDKDNEEAIDGTADEFKQYEKEGLTIFTGHVKINRPNGFLNADKVTIHEDVNTNEAIKTVAEGHVELRDGDIFATSDHAILNHVDDTVELHDNVVVIQDEDRLETKHFTFNRRTGEREGKGEVKFRVRVKQKKPAVEEDKTEQNTERAAPANTSAGEK